MTSNGCMDNRGPNYFEVDIDVSSSSVAKHVVGLVCGATKSITVDLGILIQVSAPAPVQRPIACALRATDHRFAVVHPRLVYA